MTKAVQAVVGTRCISSLRGGKAVKMNEQRSVTRELMPYKFKLDINAATKPFYSEGRIDLSMFTK